MLMYTVSVDMTWQVAMDYGVINLESVEAQSVHSHLCLPGLLLVSAGASGVATSISYLFPHRWRIFISRAFSHDINQCLENLIAVGM